MAKYIEFIISLLCLVCSLASLGSLQAQQQQQHSKAGPVPCPRAIQINTNHQFRGTLHFVCLQHVPNSFPLLEVIQYNNNQRIFSRPIQELGTNQLASFVDHDGTLRVIVAVSNRVNGTSVYSIDSQGRLTDERHTINTQLVNAVSVWRLQLNWEWQLAIANQPNIGPYTSETIQANNSSTSRLAVPSDYGASMELPLSGPMITIHSWRSTYFDKYQQIDVPFEGRISKLVPMHIHDQEFLIVAMDRPAYLVHEQQQQQQQQYLYGRTNGSSLTTEDRSPGVSSLIYKLDFGDGNLNWIQFQTLETRSALDASSFMVSHRGSLQQDHYIALIGQLETPSDPSFQQPISQPTNGTNPPNQHLLLIYKYLGDRFVVFRSIELPLGTTKLDTISFGSGNSYVIIALYSAQARSVSLYLFDGLDLKPIPSPQMRPPPPPRPRPQLYANSPAYHPYKRSMVSPASALHLFEIPVQESADSGDAENATNSKRTLSDLEPDSMPALAVSTSYEEDNFNEQAWDQTKPATGGQSDQNEKVEAVTDTSEDGVIYEIPLHEIRANGSWYQEKNLGENETIADNSTSKRGFIPGRRAPVGSELLDWCKATIERLLGDNYDTLTKQFLSLPRIDQKPPVEVHGDLHIDGNLQVNNLLYANKISELVQSTVVEQTIPEARVNFNNSLNQIDRILHDINQLKQQVDQILVDDGSLQEVYTPLSFQKLIIECLSPVSIPVPGPGRNPFSSPMNPMLGLACPRVGEIRTIHLNKHDISNLAEQALLSGRTMTIKRSVRFEHLVLKGNTKILGTLNDVRIDDIVFGANSPSSGPITGRKLLLDVLYSTGNLRAALWNGNTVDRGQVLTSSGRQQIEADLKFHQVVIDKPPQEVGNISSRIELLNGLHLDTHLSQIAQSDADNNFQIPIRFDELVLNGPVRFSPNSRLSSIDLVDLWHNTMFKSIHQNITAPMEFSGEVLVSAGGDIRINGLVNGVLLRPELVMMRDRNYNLPNSVVFHGDVFVEKDLELNQALNGVEMAHNQYSGRKELAILYDGGQQLLSGDKIFHSVHLGGQTQIQGLINGKLNLTHLNSLANNDGRPFRFANWRLNASPLRPKIRLDEGVGIHIDSAINGIHVNHLCSLAQNVSQMMSHYYHRLKFDQPITMTNLRCASINGFNNLTKSFLTRHGRQDIAGTLRLANGLLLNSTLQIGSQFNGLQAASLPVAINQAIKEIQTGQKEVLGDFHVDDLIVDGQINDLQMRDVFLVASDYPQIIRAPMRFDHLDIENVLVIGGNLNTRTFNGLNVSDIFLNTLQYDTPQVVYGQLEVENLHLLPGSNLVTKSFSGHNLQRILADSVLIDTPQQILAPKTFRSPVMFNYPVSLRHGIDGLAPEAFRFNLLVHGIDFIDDDVEFNNDVVIRKALDISTGTINDLDIDQFVRQVLSERPGLPSLRLISNSSIRFKGVQLNNLALTGRVAGIDVSRDAILKSMSGPNITALINEYHPPSAQSMPTTSPPIYYWPPSPPQSQVSPVARPVSPLALVSMPSPQQLKHLQPQQPQAQLRPFMPPQSSTIHVWQPIWNQQPNNLQARPISSSSKPLNHSLVSIKDKAPGDEYDLDDLVYKYNFVNVDMGGLPYGLTDKKYLEYRAMVRAQAINELAQRINNYLSISFYYEIAQKHPLLGPLLSEALNGEDGPTLLLKDISSSGALCSVKNQSVAVISPQRTRMYTLSSRISETNQPTLAKSLTINRQYYLFILDLNPAQVLVYVWDKRWGRYELRESIPIDGHPTVLRAFTIAGPANQTLACFALANPRLLWSSTSGPHPMYGSPEIRCQTIQDKRFDGRFVLDHLTNVFDLDIIHSPSSSTRMHQIVLAALSRQADTEQMGDLSVYLYDFATQRGQLITKRRLVRPLKLHFIKKPPAVAELSPSRVVHQLVVTEAITSHQETHAITRIFSLHLDQINLDSLRETQVIQDSQFSDVQSVMLDQSRALLFFQSAHSISIYAPTGGPSGQENAQCATQFVLVQKIPTKGANRFLVVSNNHYRTQYPANHSHQAASKLALLSNANTTITNSHSSPFFGHYLVLSQDDCEHQQYSTLILKARFH